jgi:hypothetical protein
VFWILCQQLRGTEIENSKSVGSVCLWHSIGQCKVLGMLGMSRAGSRCPGPRRMCCSQVLGEVPRWLTSLRIWEARSRGKHKERIEGRNARKTGKGRRLDRKRLNVRWASGLQGIERRRKRRWSESREYYKLCACYLAATVGEHGEGERVLLSNVVTAVGVQTRRTV